MIRSWLISSSAPVDDRRAGERKHQAVLVDGRRDGVRGPRARGAGTLAVVRLVEHEGLRRERRELLGARGEDVVVDDRDLGALAAAPAGEHRNVPRGQPAAHFPLPAELQARGTRDDRRVGAGRLDRGERLNGLAEPLLVGDERATAKQRVFHAGPLRV